MDNKLYERYLKHYVNPPKSNNGTLEEMLATALAVHARESKFTGFITPANLKRTMAEYFVKPENQIASATYRGPDRAPFGPSNSAGDLVVILPQQSIAQKIPPIKALREISGLGMKEAKDEIDKLVSGPVTIARMVDKPTADRWATAMRAVGCIVEIR